MTTLSRILCAVDPSEPAQVAFRQSLALARARDAELAVVVAVPPGEPFNRHARERTAQITGLRRASDAAGVRMRVSVQQGDPAAVILLHASSRTCDLIVLGTRHRSGFERLRAGSVAEQVARRATSPVLVVPISRDAGSRACSGGFRNVVCAVDVSTAPNAGLERVLRIVQDGTRRVTLVHALPNPAPMARDASRVGAPEQAELVKRDAWQRLQDAVPLELKATGTVRARLVWGTPSDEIVKLAGELGADLIVIGATSHGARGRGLFGSTAVRVMRSASCPVLAIPERMQHEAPLNIASTSERAKAA